jgi:hypothetical protein
MIIEMYARLLVVEEAGRVALLATMNSFHPMGA